MRICIHKAEFPKEENCEQDQNQSSMKSSTFVIKLVFPLLAVMFQAVSHMERLFNAAQIRYAFLSARAIHGKMRVLFWCSIYMLYLRIQLYDTLKTQGPLQARCNI